MQTLLIVCELAVLVIFFSFCRSLLRGRSQYGGLDDGARSHIMSPLIFEILVQGKSLLATNMLARDDSTEVNSNKDSGYVLKDSGYVLNFVQKDRVLAAVCICQCFSLQTFCAFPKIRKRLQYGSYIVTISQILECAPHLFSLFYQE